MLAPEIPRANGCFVKADRVTKDEEGFEGSRGLRREEKPVQGGENMKEGV